MNVADHPGCELHETTEDTSTEDNRQGHSGQDRSSFTEVSHPPPSGYQTRADKDWSDFHTLQLFVNSVAPKFDKFVCYCDKCKIKNYYDMSYVPCLDNKDVRTMTEAALNKMTRDSDYFKWLKFYKNTREISNEKEEMLTRYDELIKRTESKKDRFLSPDNLPKPHSWLSEDERTPKLTVPPNTVDRNIVKSRTAPEILMHPENDPENRDDPLIPSSAHDSWFAHDFPHKVVSCIQFSGPYDHFFALTAAVTFDITRSESLSDLRQLKLTENNLPKPKELIAADSFHASLLSEPPSSLSTNKQIDHVVEEDLKYHTIKKPLIKKKCQQQEKRVNENSCSLKKGLNSVRRKGADIHKPGNADIPEPKKADIPKPVRADNPKPGKADIPKPGNADIPKPVRPDLPKPGNPDIPKPGRADIPKPGKADIPKPVRADIPKPGKADIPKSGKADIHKPGKADIPKSGKADIHKPGKAEIPKPGKADIPKPGKADIPKPGKADIPKPVRADIPKPGKADIPKSGKADIPKPERTPEPGRADIPKPGKADIPKPGKADIPQPGKEDIPKSGRAEIPKPGKADIPEPGRTAIPKSWRADIPKPGRAPIPEPRRTDIPKRGSRGIPKPGRQEDPKSGSREVPKSGKGSLNQLQSDVTSYETLTEIPLSKLSSIGKNGVYHSKMNQRFDNSGIPLLTLKRNVVPSWLYLKSLSQYQESGNKYMPRQAENIDKSS